MSSLSVVIPTRNELENVVPLVEQLDAELEGIDAEILFVDDSTDGTADRIRAVAPLAHMPVRVLHRRVPVGRLAGAVVAGLEATDSPWVVVMDADLQHPPSSVPVLYREAISGDDDIVVASRYLSHGSSGGLASYFRRVVSTLAGQSAKALFPRRLGGCSDPMSGFFAVRRDALEIESITQCGYKILLALLLHRRLTISEVPFTFAPRNAGESKASLREGLRFLRLLAMLRSGPGLLFTLVGASGLLPNLLAVVVLTRLGASYLLAAAAAVQVAILWNFAGAELIVFRDRRGGKLWSRGVRFIVVSESDLIRLPFASLLVELLRLGPVLATAISLVVFVSLRYALAVRLVYRQASAVVASRARARTL